MYRFFQLSILIAVCSTALLADASYTETTRFTGGTIVDMMRSMAAGPMGRITGRSMGKAFQDQNDTVYIKGGKMARWGQANSTVIDVDGGTITSIQNERHTYSVMTFDQMEQMMNRTQHGQSGGDVKFDIKVRQTGNTKPIDGQTATETLITMTATSPDANRATMVVHSDYWSVPNEPGANDVHEFFQKLAKRYQGMPGGNPMMGAASKGISAALLESMKGKGHPVQMKTDISGVSSPMAGMMGRSGGGDPNSPFLVMESQYSNFAAGSVDDSKFTVPDGYKLQTRER